MNESLVGKLEVLERRHFWKGCGGLIASAVCLGLALQLFSSQYVLSPDVVAAGLLGGGTGTLLQVIRNWRSSRELLFARELVQHLVQENKQ